jgi:hypothetical protein
LIGSVCAVKLRLDPHEKIAVIIYSASGPAWSVGGLTRRLASSKLDNALSSRRSFARGFQMGDLPRVRLTRSRSARPLVPAISTLIGVAGGAASVATLIVCAVLAVVFAATLAIVMVLASLLLALAGFAWRLQSRALHRGAIRQRSGHAWVAYDWNRNPG